MPIKSSTWKKHNEAFRAKRVSKKVSSYKMVAKVLANRAEAKEVVTNISATLTNETAATQVVKAINLVAEGNDYNTRVGRKITHKYCEINIVVYNVGGAGVLSVGDAGFWSVVLDLQPNGALPLFADIYESTILNNAGTAFKNTRLYQDRFRVLAHEDWTVECCQTTTVSLGASPYRIKRYIDMSKLTGKDATGNFNGTGATIGDFNSGALLFIFASSLSGTGVSTTNLVAQSKYRFTDV